MLIDNLTFLVNSSFDAAEALEFGYISKVVPDPAKVLSEALATATLIAEKSPVAAIGTKYGHVNPAAATSRITARCELLLTISFF